MASRVPLSALSTAFRSDIERAVEILKSAGCSKVYLFGSVAEERLRAGSDIDIAVRGCPAGEYFKLQGRLLMELEHPVDLVNLDRDADLAGFLEKEDLLVDVG